MAPKLFQMSKFYVSLRSIFIACLCFLFIINGSLAKSSSKKPISDEEIRKKKNECYADIESGLWGLKCASSLIMKENCALRCVSPLCYHLIYEGDPLEEGEIDYARSQEYKFCLQRDSMGESLDNVKGSFNY